MTKTKQTLRNWYGHRFQSSSGTMPEFAKFAREFKAAIKSQLGPGTELVAFNRGYFYCSGFVKRGDKFVYFMTSDVRHFPDAWADNFLVRTAAHEKDYTGGRNQRTDLKNFGTVVDQIFEGHAFVTLV